MRDNCYQRGEKAWAPVELLDIVPTLYEMAELTLDVNYIPWEGVSLVPLLKNVTGYVKQAAISQYFRSHGSTRIWGYTVRTVRYRYTNWGFFTEMYDYLSDPWEVLNLKNPGLQTSIECAGYYNGDFERGAGKQPFDFDQLNSMMNRPPQPYP